MLHSQLGESGSDDDYIFEWFEGTCGVYICHIEIIINH